MKRLLRVLGAAGLALGLLAYPAAWAVDRAAGRDLLIVEASDPSAVEVQRGLWELDGSKREGIPEIYGNPTQRPERLVLVPEGKIVRPVEDPSIEFYLKAAGDHPVQAMTLYFFALPATIGGLVAGAGLLLVASRLKGAATPATPPAPG